MKLKTARCHIYQLTKAQFQQFIDTPSTPWNQLGVVGERAHEPWFRDFLLQSLHMLDEMGCQACWLTNWAIVEIVHNTVIGGITFKGPPNQAGEVEIGYGIAEAAGFLNQAMDLNLSTDDIAALDSRTEGWIAGLQLAAISIQGQKDVSSLIASFTGSHRFVLDYLLEEVLHQQPEHIQSFLLRTSILDRLCGSLCEAVVCFS